MPSFPRTRQHCQKNKNKKQTKTKPHFIYSNKLEYKIWPSLYIFILIMVLKTQTCQSQYKIDIDSSQLSTCLSLSCGSGTSTNIIRKKVTHALSQSVGASSCLTVTFWGLCQYANVFWFKVRNCFVTKCLWMWSWPVRTVSHTFQRWENGCWNSIVPIQNGRIFGKSDSWRLNQLHWVCLTTRSEEWKNLLRCGAHTSIELGGFFSVVGYGVMMQPSSSSSCLAPNGEVLPPPGCARVILPWDGSLNSSSKNTAQKLVFYQFRSLEIFAVRQDELQCHRKGSCWGPWPGRRWSGITPFGSK